MKKMLTLLLAACLLCGILTACVHSHTWDAATGKCTECEETHEHEYDASTGVCAECGYTCKHKYTDGKCTKCGKTTIFRWELFDPLNESLMNENAHKGTVETVNYTTHAYPLEKDHPEDGDIMIEKTMYVYTPYNYDESQQYNVLFLLHGSGESEGYWFAQGDYDAEHGYASLTNFTQNMLDNLIDQGVCEPMIVVTPTTNVFLEGYDDPSNTNDDYHVKEFYMEFENVILPYIVDNYATYAKSSSVEDMIAARDHIAFAGFSRGSRATWNSLIGQSLEYIGWFGSYSGGASHDLPQQASEQYQIIIDNINNNADKYKINYWYHGNGTLDTAHDPHVAGYAYILEKCPGALVDGDGTSGNCTFVDIPKGGHNYQAWIVDLYNCLLVFFK